MIGAGIRLHHAEGIWSFLKEPMAPWSKTRQNSLHQ